jgi:antitoxin YefM
VANAIDVTPSSPAAAYCTISPYDVGTAFTYDREAHVMAISASEARQRLFPLLEQVNTDHEPVRITSRAGDAVLMSADDYDSWQETVYLLRSPENARRLMEAVARDKASHPAPAMYSKSINELQEMAGGEE